MNKIRLYWDIISPTLGIVFISAIMFFVVGMILSIPLCLLWNWLMPFIFGLPELNLLQIIGLSVLVNMLFSKPPHNTETSTVGVEASSNAVKEYYKMRDEMEQSFKK